MAIIQQAKDLISDEANVVFVDVRTRHDHFPDGQTAYNISHIKGAVFLDLHQDLTGETTFLPMAEKLADKLGSLGISNGDAIVLYDQGNQRAVSKAWAALRYLGHEKVYILQGGFPAWVAAGGEVVATDTKRDAVIYRSDVQAGLLMDLSQVKEKLAEDDVTLIDSRGHRRYSGEVEPKYKKAGHIPGAKNYEAKKAFDEHGNWKSKTELQENFRDIHSDDEIIVSCGSGNSACMNLVALTEAGFTNVKLFSGGFSDWIEDDNNKVEKGDGK